MGKTHAIRRFGGSFDNFVEINFESTPSTKSVFEADLSPQRIIRDLGLLTQQTITPGKTLLFLDEIQEQPKALLALRYLYEELPDLHVIAAGSLLDFAIDQVGIPVGRVEFLFMRPMSFIEFLCASDNRGLAEVILNQKAADPLLESIHQKITRLLGEYLATGGMPEIIQLWINDQDINSVLAAQQNIVNSYIQDIPKYTRKTQISTVDVVFKHIPYILGQRFKTNAIKGEYRKREIIPALDLLDKAMIIQKIVHTSAQGLPLAAQSDLDKFKLILVDFALSQRLLNSDQREWILNPKEAAINKGPVIEAFIGQELLCYQNPTTPGELFYWHREERSSSAEVDYVIAAGREILPIEVKSDKGGSLKSMRVFQETHPKSPYGIRFSNHNYSIVDDIHSYPLYAAAALFPEQHAALLAL